MLHAITYLANTVFTFPTIRNESFRRKTTCGEELFTPDASTCHETASRCKVQENLLRVRDITFSDKNAPKERNMENMNDHEHLGCF